MRLVQCRGAKSSPFAAYRIPLLAFVERCDRPQMDAGNEALEEQVRVMDTEVREISAKAKADAEALEDAGAAAEEFVRDKEAAEAAASSAT